MIPRNINKLAKVQSKASIDIRESRYLCGGHRLKHEAKKVHKRAQRRMGKALIEEQRAA